MKHRPHIRREKKYTEAGLRQTKGEKVYEKTCLTVRHVFRQFRQIDMEFSVWYNRDNKSEFVERFPELSLFFKAYSLLDSEMICIFPYLCPYAESAREIREIFS